MIRNLSDSVPQYGSWWILTAGIVLVGFMTITALMIVFVSRMTKCSAQEAADAMSTVVRSARARHRLSIRQADRGGDGGEL